jgi:hypothetical protein
VKIVKLVQIGDIHYPQHTSRTELGDVKDSAVAVSMAQAATAPPLVSAIREVIHFCEDNATDLAAVLICGDLETISSLPS